MSATKIFFLGGALVTGFFGGIVTGIMIMNNQAIRIKYPAMSLIKLPPYLDQKLSDKMTEKRDTSTWD